MTLFDDARNDEPVIVEKNGLRRVRGGVREVGSPLPEQLRILAFVLFASAVLSVREVPPDSEIS